MFNVDRVYNRSTELHDVYGGNRQSGICPCPRYSIVLLFTSPAGEEHGYRDRFISEKIYQYTGEGQIGNMELKRGNYAIKYHESMLRHLHLFKKEPRGDYRYLGEFKYLRHAFETGLDNRENERRMIVFTLEKID